MRTWLDSLSLVGFWIVLFGGGVLILLETKLREQSLLERRSSGLGCSVLLALLALCVLRGASQLKWWLWKLSPQEAIGMYSYPLSLQGQTHYLHGSWANLIEMGQWVGAVAFVLLLLGAGVLCLLRWRSQWRVVGL